MIHPLLNREVAMNHSRIRLNKIKLKSASRPIHYHHNTDQTYHPAYHIVKVRALLVDEPAPKNRQYYEYTSIGSVNSSEMGWLKGGDDSVQK